MEKQISNKGIKLITEAVGAAACEVIGLGPEDPLADACALVFVTLGSHIVEAVVDKHLTQGEDICKYIHYC